MVNLNGMTYYENVTVIEFYDAPDEDSLWYDFSSFESSHIIAVHLFYDFVTDLECSEELQEEVLESGTDNDLLAIYTNCEVFIRWETISTNVESSLYWRESENTVSIYLHDFDD